MTNSEGSTVGTYSGHDLVDRDNHRVGTVTDVIYDDAEDKPELLIVDPGILSAERIVPLDRAYTSANGNIVVPYDKDHVKHAPRAPDDHVLTDADHDQVDRHYGIDRGAGVGAWAGKRYLLLADGHIDGDGVRTHLRLTEPADVVVHVVVPSRELTEGERRMVEIEGPRSSDGTEPSVVAAQWRLRSAMDALRSAGFDQVTGAVGDADAVDAVDAALASGSFDQVAVVTGPIGLSGWVHLDLPHRIERHVGEPVIHIEADDPAS